MEARGQTRQVACASKPPWVRVAACSADRCPGSLPAHSMAALSAADDAVDAAQGSLDELGQLFYSSIGEVWQHAAPVAVAPGAAGGQEGAAANARLAQHWAAQLGSATRELQSAVEQVTASVATEGRDEQAALQEEEGRGVAEGDRLVATVESAEEWLAELQRTIRLVNGRVVAAKTARGDGGANDGDGGD